MTCITKLKLSGAALYLILHCSGAQASLIEYEYSGGFSFGSDPFGIEYKATVIFDNGGTSAASQTFGADDFVSARLQSGNYDFTMFADNITMWWFDFTSNAFGILDNGWFDASDSGHFWHFDTTYLADANFTAPNGVTAGYLYPYSGPGRVIPEPTPISLIWLGLAGIVWSGRKARK